MNLSNTGTGKAASSASVPADEFHEFPKEQIKDNHAREKERRDFVEKSTQQAREDFLKVLSQAIIKPTAQLSTQPTRKKGNGGEAALLRIRATLLATTINILAANYVI